MFKRKEFKRSTIQKKAKNHRLRKFSEYRYKQGLRASRRMSHSIEYEPVLQTSLILTKVLTERRVKDTGFLP